MRKIKCLLLSVLCLSSVCAMAQRKAIIFDTDWWTDVDDACAVRILHSAQMGGLVEIKGICLSAVNETSVESISAFMQYEGMDGIALGADKQATDYTGQPGYHRLIIENCPETSRKTLDDCEDAVDFYRRILTESKGKVDIVAVGYPNTLSRLLESGPDKYSDMDGVKLVKKKVGRLWMMAGNYPEGAENNFIRTPRSVKAGFCVCEKWPTEIVFLGYEIGIQVKAGGTLPEDDVLKMTLNIHYDFDGRFAWDPMTVYMACLGSAEKAGFDVTKGRNVVNGKDGSNIFYPSPKGRHYYVKFKKSPAEIKDILNDILNGRTFNN